MVDDKKIGMTPAVEISYLKPEEQNMYARLLDATLAGGAEDTNGILFVRFPIVELAAALSRSSVTVKRSLKELEDTGLKYNCQLTRLDFRQEEGLMSSLPLGLNQVEIQRGLTTSSTAVFVPFTTQELFQSGKEALYCGLNALSNNLIMVDRKLLKNPNGLILGTPGSGKSFAAKREIVNVMLLTGDHVIVCDPESEVRHEVA